MTKERVVLTLNLGSTSLKAAVFDRSAAGDWVAPRNSRNWPFEISPGPGSDPMPAINDTVQGESTGLPISALMPELESWMLADGAEPDAIVHRIVHGGTLEGPCFLDASNIATLSRLAEWAPEHQAPALSLVEAASARWPLSAQVALFDTDWHRSLPALTRTFALSRKLRDEGLHRFGFHGVAYQSVWRQFRVLRADAMDRRVVFAHLGGGSSLCAVRGGRSIDTTMGLTPMDGLPMATRCGSIDPGVILHLLRNDRFSVSSLALELNRNSGLFGLSGISGDMQQLLAINSVESRLAVDIYVHRVAQGIASMATTLGGLDDLVFSGGIGTHSSATRSAVVETLNWIGLKIDPEANSTDRQSIETPASSAKILVLEAYEDRELALASSMAP